MKMDPHCHWEYISTIYRLRWYCCAILSGGRYSELRLIYQGCRALTFVLARLSCCWSKLVNVKYTLRMYTRWKGFGCRVTSVWHYWRPSATTQQSGVNSFSTYLVRFIVQPNTTVIGWIFLLEALLIGTEMELFFFHIKSSIAIAMPF